MQEGKRMDTENYLAKGAGSLQGQLDSGLNCITPDDPPV